MTNNRNSWRVLFIVFLLSIALNLIWEFWHVRYYTVPGGVVFGLRYPWFLLVATFWDGIIVAGLYSFVAILWQDSEWYKYITFYKILTLILSGLLIALFIEHRALWQGKWGYTPSMPIIPIMHAGLTPILQMILLPPIVVCMLKKVLK